MKLLTVANAKTSKGEKLGYLTGILYLSPANESGVLNTCANASQGCTRDCLYFSGRAQIFPEVIAARIRKTEWLARDRAGFLDQLRADVRSLVKRAARMRLIPAVRINGTSDLPWLSLTLAVEFPNVQFYDYTKHPRAPERVRPNYHLTFSHAENNLAECLRALQNGINCAVVFDTRKGHPLPPSWHGYKVIDGDIHDLRFLDVSPVVIGLRAKGSTAKHDTSSGFVQVSSLFTPISRRAA